VDAVLIDVLEFDKFGFQTVPRSFLRIIQKQLYITAKSKTSSIIDLRDVAKA